MMTKRKEAVHDDKVEFFLYIYSNTPNKTAGFLCCIVLGLQVLERTT